MTRDEARAYFTTSGLTYSIISKGTMARLKIILDREMSSSGLISGSFITDRVPEIRRPKTKVSAHLRCKSNYFKGRQAITFEPDGFIGFAGWADDENVQPILRGFCAWVDETAQSEGQLPKNKLS